MKTERYAKALSLSVSIHGGPTQQPAPPARAEAGVEDQGQRISDNMDKVGDLLIWLLGRKKVLTRAERLA